MRDVPPQQHTPEDVTAIPSEAIHCISGLIYQVLRPGTGKERPGPDDVVQVLYKARTETGHLFETAGEQGTPQTFSISKVISGLAEALQLMTVGQKMRVWIPPNLSSNELQEAHKGTLIFDIELVSFTRVKEPPSLPIELTSPRKEE
jgi:FKBP-type peptidyl-prolyl cis-trans isomerase